MISIYKQKTRGGIFLGGIFWGKSHGFAQHKIVYIETVFFIVSIPGTIE